MLKKLILETWKSFRYAEYFIELLNIMMGRNIRKKLKG
jgi:hypothetical protein